MLYKACITIVSLSLGMQNNAIHSFYSGINQMKTNYLEENIHYCNQQAGITLAGTITIPDLSKKNPAVILIAGYGKHDRNVSFMGKQPFKILADYLAQKGIAVLRYDKRGAGTSTGDYEKATSKDFVADVVAGIEYLKTRNDIDASQIGLIGLSEGGLIASMVASEFKDVAFVVLLAPAVLTNPEDLVEMTGLQLRADGASKEFIKNDAQLRKQIFTIVKNESDSEVAKNKLQQIVAHYLVQLPESQKAESAQLPWAFTQEKSESMINTFNSVWYRYFLRCKPNEMLKKIKVPVLALNGDHDWIVSPDIVFPILDAALKEAGNNDYSLIKLANINHMFQMCKTGALSEYGEIQEAISPLVLSIIADWILERIRLID